MNPQLLAVTDSVNQGKSDSGPEAWKPSLSMFLFGLWILDGGKWDPRQLLMRKLESYWCTYAKMWIKVKYVYDLTITSAEKSALVTMMDTC